MKSASASPRGEAREPSSYYWCSTRIDRLLEQTQRRAYGSASRALRRGGDGKIFLAGRVSPNRDLRTQLLHLNVRIQAIEPRQSTFSDPFLLYDINTIRAIHIHLAGGRPVRASHTPALPNSLESSSIP